ncbi:hypothetical protein LCGC14_1284710 [marine sediment metagenome]|uniref:Uncharacterized protein n=1 Tax=marine sediment metagenome TaxID=412755 RepID=A0A0F9LF89_9ZZZZ
MRKLLVIALAGVLVLALVATPVMGAGGFDTYGYNYQARLFNGLLGNADRDSDPATYWGHSTDVTTIDGIDYVAPVAGTHLVMKWSKAWDDAKFGPDGIRDNGDELPWTTDAWVTNHYTWTDAQGTHTVYFRIEWTGSGGELWAAFTITRAIFDGQKIR